jgi:two-component system chemotaxis response regulator CheY
MTTKTVLVIDDSAAIRLAIRRILEKIGFAVDEAADGAEALARVSALPSVVLCDIDMPVMDGLAFVRELRKRPEQAALPVIMCTTHNSFEKMREALAAGANEYIMKPFDAEIIASKLAQCGVC